MSVNRVLHVVGAMNRGGAETMLMSIYRAIDRDLLQFDFLELMPGRSHFTDEIEALGGRILKAVWSSNPADTIKTTRALSAQIAASGPYIAVHSHVLFASGIVLAASKKAGIKVRVAHSHNTSAQGSGMAESAYHLVSRIAIRLNATRILACGKDAGRFLFGNSWFESEGIVIPNAVDGECFHAPSQKERIALRARYGFSAHETILVSIARLEPVKNHQFLIDLVTKLQRSPLTFKMLFVGDGSLRKNLETEVKNRKLQGVVEFWGIRKDVGEIMRASDILLMPSFHEGLPVSLIEAQASGLRAIVSDNVSTEADMGLGLLEYISLEDMESWFEKVIHSSRSRVDNEEIQEALEQRGYNLQASVEKCLQVYDVI